MPPQSKSMLRQRITLNSTNKLKYLVHFRWVSAQSKHPIQKKNFRVSSSKSGKVFIQGEIRLLFNTIFNDSNETDDFTTKIEHPLPKVSIWYQRLYVWTLYFSFQFKVIDQRIEWKVWAHRTPLRLIHCSLVKYGCFPPPLFFRWKEKKSRLRRFAVQNSLTTICPYPRAAHWPWLYEFQNTHWLLFILII